MKKHKDKPPADENTVCAGGDLSSEGVAGIDNNAGGPGHCVEAGADEVVLSIEDYEKMRSGAQKSQEYYEQMLRIQAEFDNYRKRVMKEKSELHKYANEKIISDILPIMDNFPRALKALEEHVSKENHKFYEGIDLIYRQFVNVMDKNGVREIEAVGKSFDPNFHHALQTVENDNEPENTIVAELAKGYVLHDRVLRASAVVVSKKNDSPDSKAE